MDRTQQQSNVHAVIMIILCSSLSYVQKWTSLSVQKNLNTHFLFSNSFVCVNLRRYFNFRVLDSKYSAYIGNRKRLCPNSPM